MHIDLSTTISLLNSIVVFRNVAESDVLKALRNFLCESEGVQSKIKRYSDFVSELFKYSYNFSDYLLDAVAVDENIYVILRSHNSPIPNVLSHCIDGELSVFQQISELTADDLIDSIGYSGYLPRYESSQIDFHSEYESRIKKISTIGYGIYARNTMFRVEEGKIVPIKSPDNTSISDLIGYEAERQQLIDNTIALISGKPAANTLLCGDAGTGKSSSVKAVANMFSSQGVRLIEMRKDQLSEIPSVMEHVRDNPLKFIIFIDDLSFSRNDDNFSALKAILEGSASVKASNSVIYATSNRRHLVKESFSDREGDDIHRTDTMQEILSLSERFGLTILFTKPSKALYLEIVHEMCLRNDIVMDSEELELKACAFALRKGGFTPRAAEQFTENLLSMI